MGVQVLMPMLAPAAEEGVDDKEARPRAADNGGGGILTTHGDAVDNAVDNAFGWNEALDVAWQTTPTSSSVLGSSPSLLFSSDFVAVS
mmetsp:Transcript_24003/g.70811  ORF Transcript_24003/g.70811 Transcript_24003/m.70811 type:complete len:88 (+) Transcript_24003:38-301(+)